MLLVLLGSVATPATLRARMTIPYRRTGAQSHRGCRPRKCPGAILPQRHPTDGHGIAEDATPFIDSYRQAVAEGDQQLLGVQVELTALGDTDTLAALGSFTEETRQQAEQVRGSRRLCRHRRRVH